MARLTKAKVKLFASLHLKKYRSQHEMFVAEGQKMLKEALRSNFELIAVVKKEGTEVENWDSIPEDSRWEADAADFNRLSTQVNGEGVLAVLRFPEARMRRRVQVLEELPAGPVLILDDLRDPGNVGTLIRTAEWFGAGGMVFSSGTVDPYHPKVVRAAMGSLFRVPVIEVDDLVGSLENVADQLWVAAMEGADPREVELSGRPGIVIGNEARGVRREILELAGAKRISIPGFGAAESLNAGVAGSVLAALWRLGS